MPSRSYKRRRIGYSGVNRRSGVTKTRNLMYRSRNGNYVVPRSTGAINNSENKYFNSFLSNDTIVEGTSLAGLELDPSTLNTLFAPTEGNDISDRQGRKVWVKGIRLRGMIQLRDSTNTRVDQTSVRLILYMDKQTNAAQVQSETYLESAGSASENIFCAFQNLDSLGRFKTIKDKIYRIPVGTVWYNGTATGTQGTQVPFKWNITFKRPIQVNFNNTNGGTVADIVDNSFHIVGMAESESTATTLLLSYNCRVRFFDK